MQFLNGFAIVHTPQGTHEVWKIAKKPNPLVKFGCGSDCVKRHLLSCLFYLHLPPAGTRSLAANANNNQAAAVECRQPRHQEEDHHSDTKELNS